MLDVGLRAATIDLGGWDTHTGQDNGNFFANNLLAPLAQGLAAFFNDLDSQAQLTQRLTIVMQSEFGRRCGQNADRGTDHGSGNVMLVLGRTINGGQLYGTWPGLAPEQLYEGEDLEATTDFRQVLGEVIAKRLQNPALSSIFPGFDQYAPLGLVKSKNQ